MKLQNYTHHEVLPHLFLHLLTFYVSIDISPIIRNRGQSEVLISVHLPSIRPENIYLTLSNDTWIYLSTRAFTDTYFYISWGKSRESKCINSTTKTYNPIRKVYLTCPTAINSFLPVDAFIYHPYLSGNKVLPQSPTLRLERYMWHDLPTCWCVYLSFISLLAHEKGPTWGINLNTHLP